MSGVTSQSVTDVTMFTCARCFTASLPMSVIGSATAAPVLAWCNNNVTTLLCCGWSQSCVANWGIVTRAVCECVWGAVSRACHCAWSICGSTSEIIVGQCGRCGERSAREESPGLTNLFLGSNQQQQVPAATAWLEPGPTTAPPLRLCCWLLLTNVLHGAATRLSCTDSPETAKSLHISYR